MSNANVASWVFASVALLYLAGITTYLTIRQREDNLPLAASFILGFLCAIAGGFCTYFFTGELGLNFEVPLTNIKGNAAGGLAVFVLVMLLWYQIIVKPAVKASTAAEQAKQEKTKRLAAERAAAAKAEREEAERLAAERAAAAKAEREEAERLAADRAAAAKAAREGLVGRLAEERAAEAKKDGP
jgi:signal transduction histidine kinase